MTGGPYFACSAWDDTAARGGGDTKNPGIRFSCLSVDDGGCRGKWLQDYFCISKE